MTPADLVDRLAEWCRLSERGWRRDPESGVLCEPEWVRDVPGGVEIWRPDESDDDCRVVLEECHNRGMSSKLLDAMYDLSGADDDRYDMLEYLTVFEQFLLFASPREKCLAVARVLGDA